MSRHAGRVAVVTGGASGIGLAIAQRLAADGARVAVLDITPLDAASVGVSMAVVVDITDADDVRDAVEAITSRLGPPSIIVHSAVHQFVQPFEDVSYEAWRRVQSVNVDGLFHLVQATLPLMRTAHWGRIIAITSSTFFVGARNMAPYVTSKGALTGFVHGLAAEIGADGITINAVAPGLTRTPPTENDLPAEMFADIAALQAIPRTGEPRDQAGVVSFLASDDAAFITGQTILVDGGQGRS